MDALRFLSIADALMLHEDAIAVDGGLGGMRDMRLLEAAIAMPRQQFGGAYLHEDVAAMAAAYLFHLCMNHPFHDGNKRVALMVMLTFLDQNGVELKFDNRELGNTVLAIASSQMTKTELTEWLRGQIGRIEAR